MNPNERALVRQGQLQVGVGSRTPLKAKGLTGVILEGTESALHLAGEAFKAICPIVPAGPREVIVIQRWRLRKGTRFFLATERPGQPYFKKHPFVDTAHRVNILSEQMTEHQVRVEPQIGAEEVKIDPIAITYRVADPVRLIRDFGGDGNYQRGMIGYATELAVREAFEEPTLLEQAQRGIYNEAIVSNRVQSFLAAGLPQIAGAELRNVIFESTPPPSVQRINAARMEIAESEFKGTAELRRFSAFTAGIDQISDAAVEKTARLAQARALLTAEASQMTMINVSGLIPGLSQVLGGGGPAGGGPAAEAPRPVGPSQPEMSTEPVQFDISPLFNAAVDFANQRVQQMGWGQEELRTRFSDPEGRQGFTRIVMSDLQRAVSAEGMGKILNKEINDKTIKSLLQERLDQVLSSSI